MLIPLAVVDDVAILDPRTHNNMLHPVYVLFDSRTMSHNHHPTPPPPPPWSVNMYNNVPRRLMSHNHHPTPPPPPPWSVNMYNNVPRRLMSHYHNNVPTRLLSNNGNNVPNGNNVSSRLMSHNGNNFSSRLMSHNRINVSSRSTSSTSRNNVSSRFTSSTVSMVDETLVYDSTINSNIPRTRSFNLHHNNNGTRASSSPVNSGQNTRNSAAVLMGVQEHVTTSTIDAESICCICLVHLSNASSTPIQLRCSHIFHTDCIQKWVNIRQTCPLCRADV
ncbi:unnamed protein product [Vicia faba]|uniref:RING-type domain-containing protein n=1 Tax=Vicia faba TaxID=3906 RepID=A0AAV1A8K9_VICFA|nr:unnamed protein product [Vicia faba]